MRIKNLLFLLLIGTLLLTCKKEKSHEAGPQPPILSSEKDIIEFIVYDSLNKAYINETVAGNINDTEITLFIPQFTNVSSLVSTFKTTGVAVRVGTADQASGETTNDFSEPVVYCVFAEDGSYKNYVVKISPVKALKTALPHFFINTVGAATIDKDNYTNAFLQIEGKDQFNDYDGSMRIKGRGNESWGFPKKPYKIKLDSKASLLGLPSEKEWILLSEYRDGSMLYNSIAYTIAHQINMPYTNHIIPVELTLNGKYQGVYAFTEQKEVKKNRIDIGDDGLLLELDTYFDENWKFLSDNYGLPVMVQYPEEEDMDNGKLNVIKNDFQTFENLVFDASFPNNNYLDYFDERAFVDYMIVYTLTGNIEINHPKSTYIHKLAGGKYRMGIIWDFDWAFGFETQGAHYVLSSSSIGLFWDGTKGNKPGTKFFSKLMSDPHLRSVFKERWNWYKANKFTELKEYVSDYATLVGQALVQDHSVWGNRGSTDDTEKNLQKALTWLDARSNYIDDYVSRW